MAASSNENPVKKRFFFFLNTFYLEIKLFDTNKFLFQKMKILNISDKYFMQCELHTYGLLSIYLRFNFVY